MASTVSLTVPASYPDARPFTLPRGLPRPPRGESLLIFALAALGYYWLGYEVVTVDHVVVFDALDRLTRAYMAWHDSPAKLAAVGFSYPPITSLVFLPFAILKPLATSLIAVPLMSALFAAATLVVLNRTLAVCELSRIARYPLLILFALGPEFAFYASNGLPDAVYLYLLAGAVYCFVSWYQSEQSRYLMGAGLAMALCLLTRYEFITWAFAGALFIAATLWRGRRSGQQVEGSVIAYLAPIVYGLALWTLFCAVIVGQPFEWVSESYTSGQTVDTAQAAAGSDSFGAVVHHLAQVTVAVAPLALLAIPAAVILFLATRDTMTLWLATFTVLGLVVSGVDALVDGHVAVLTLSDGLPVALCALVTAAWLYRSQDALRGVVWLATAAALALTLPLSYHAAQHYPYQSLEQAFVRAVKTGSSQEGTTSIGPVQVGIDPEREMADYIDQLAGLGRHSILVDNAQSYAVILLSGRPQLMLDRVDRGDGAWLGVRNAPFGKVRYMLIAYRSSADLIEQRYPLAARGGVAGLTPVFRTSRYLLVAVAPHAPPARAAVPATAPGAAAP